MTRNIKEDQLDPEFRARLEKLFADVANLNYRFPTESSHHTGLVEAIRNVVDEKNKMKDELENMIESLDQEL